MNKIKHIIFDFDGTLADTMSEMINIYNENHLKFKVNPVIKDELGSLRAKSPRNIMRALNISFFKLPGIALNLKRELKSRIPKIQPFANISNLVGGLKDKGYKLSILSSNSEENISDFLTINDLNSFDFIYSASNLFGKHKALAKIIKKAGLSKDSIIYVGDEIRDIDAVRKIGLPIIAVSWGYNTGDTLKQHSPDYYVERPEEILNIVGNIK